MLAISCNPMVSLPNNTYIREAYEKLEFFAQVDFFLSETARYADVVLAGSLMEEDEGTTTNVEGRVIHHKKAVDPPGDARVDWEIICDIACPAGQPETNSNSSHPKRSLMNCASRPKAGFATTTG